MPVILAIESSCDDTSAAVIADGIICSNITATQAIHSEWGGVVPELASRAHQQHISVTVHAALQEAGIELDSLDAIAFTQGPGLAGALLVGMSFAKGLALALNKPLIAVNHMRAHVMANYIEHDVPNPHLCLTVSGGHTQLVWVTGDTKMQVIGETIDDAAGEAFDKTAKLLGLPYPGGPLIDKLAQKGNPNRFTFASPKAGQLDFSFSGLKTSVRYFLEKEVRQQPDFIERNKEDLCASIQQTIISILLKQTQQALQTYPAKALTLAGGVSANSGLRRAFGELGVTLNLPVFIPSMQYCTDNAAMIAKSAHYQFLEGDFAGQDAEILPRFSING